MPRPPSLVKPGRPSWRERPYLERERLGAWRERLKLKDGRRMLVRPIEAADAPALIAGFKVLTPEEVRARFLHPLTELTPELAMQLADIDRRRDFALVVAEDAAPGQALVGAVARLSRGDAANTAEFALIVARPLSRQGLGRYLMKKLVRWAMKHGLTEIYGDVLRDNVAMLKLVESIGFKRDERYNEPGVVRVVLALPAPPDVATIDVAPLDVAPLDVATINVRVTP